MMMYELCVDNEVQHCPGCGYKVTNLYSMAASEDEATMHRDRDDIALCGDCMCGVLASSEHTIIGPQVD